MPVQDNDQKPENLRQLARTISINALVRVLIIFSLPVIGVGIILFFRTKIGFSLGVFVGGFAGIARLLIYYYDKKKKNYYSQYYKLGHFICDLLLIIGMWWFALYILQH